MLLYKNPQNTYLAIAENLGCARIQGFEPCFNGQDVPDIICQAYIRDYGGWVVRDVDECCSDPPCRQPRPH